MDSGSGRERLLNLLESNGAFARALEAQLGPAGKAERLAAAHPVAVVLGCSDSRVPPETVFDLGIGDLFVIRVAGNVACSEAAGSIEYAVARWDLPLVVVLGHTECGAVAAVLDPPVGEAVPDVAGSPHLASLLVNVRSNVAFAHFGAIDANGAPLDRWRLAVEANVRQTVQSLLGRSSLVRARASAGRLLVAGALYNVRTGCVSVLEGR